MKVKEIQNIICNMSDDEEIVLLNNNAPINATNTIIKAYVIMTQIECENIKNEKTERKLILMYSTKERNEKNEQTRR